MGFSSRWVFSLRLGNSMMGFVSSFLFFLSAGH